MKTIIKEASLLASILISVLLFAVSCGDDKEEVQEEPTPVAPTITNFVPAHGVPGTTITITGTGLEEVSAVTIGGKEIAISGDVTDTEIKVVTTEDITGGKVKVTTPYGTAETTSEFTVDAVFHAPSLSVVPQGNISFFDEITLEGENLDIVEKVLFGTVEAEIARTTEADIAVRAAKGGEVADDATKLKVKVPFYEGDAAVNISLGYQEEGVAKTVDTGKSFTVTPRPPKLTNVSSITGEFFEDVTLTGTDLNLVKEVLFGETAATMDADNSSATTLKVQIPYYGTTDAVTITLKYQYGATDPVDRSEPSTDKFTVKNTRPENVDCPASIMLGATFDITGTNLDKVEKVLFNETEITATLSDDKTKLTCSLPGSVTGASTGNKIIIKYWKGNGSQEISSNFEVKVIANYIWKNVKLSAKAGEQNYFSVTTGQNYTADNYKGVMNDQLLLTLTPKWGGANAYTQVASLYTTTAPRPGLPLKFRRVGFNTTIEGLEQGVIDFIKGTSESNVENTPISWAKMQELGYDITSREASVIRYKFNDDDYNNGTSGNGKFEATKPGQVSAVIFKTDASGTVLGIGFVELVSVDGDNTQEGVQGASWTVNIYFPKDILKDIDQVVR